MVSAQTDSAKGIVITCVAGPDSGKRLSVSDQPVTIGRSAQCNVLSDDPDVAERQASFRVENGKVRYEAIAPAAVFVDGNRSDAGALEPRQQLRLGRSLWQAAEPDPAHRYSDLLSDIGGRISEAAGVERIKGFDIVATFSEVFSKHSDDEVEAFFNVGGPTTTPEIPRLNTNWPKPRYISSCIRMSPAVSRNRLSCNVINLI